MKQIRLKRYATILGTFSIALGIGFVMQNGDVLASRFGVDDHPVDLESLQDESYRPVTASGSATLLGPNGPVENIFAIDTTPVLADAAVSTNCDIRFEAVPAPQAIVALSLHAPCNPDALVTIQHHGLKFNDLTDDAGRMNVVVPALSKEAYFVATVQDAGVAVAITGVRDLDLYNRAVVQWRGDAALNLHASKTDGGETTPDFGFLTELGAKDAAMPLMAKVYSYPSGISGQDQDIALDLRILVTADTCGQALSAQSIQVEPNLPPAAQKMTLDLPACDNIGEEIVLKNMFEDLTLATR